MKTLRIGSRGADVTELQGALNWIGSNPKMAVQKSMYGPLETDGIFGQKTHVRVVEFQKKNGLAADGIVGPKTLAKLAELTGGSIAQSNRPGGGVSSGGGKDFGKFGKGLGKDFGKFGGFGKPGGGKTF
ncbi:MAG: peptidoglycan-binding domain-containing protein [bacterium]